MRIELLGGLVAFASWRRVGHPPMRVPPCADHAAHLERLGDLAALSVLDDAPYARHIGAAGSSQASTIEI